MWEDLEVALEKVDLEQKKSKPDDSALGFGTWFTDHMFQMKWNREQGWHDAKISPFRDFSMSPASMVFHYGQAIFEGLKAFRAEDDQINLFRPSDNFERMNLSAIKMCMPRIPADRVIKALKALVYLDRDWIPASEGASLYIRPTMIASEPALGVRSATEFTFFIIMSPVAAYYKEGFTPTKIYVSDEHVRAVKGGVGDVKAACNYAASLYMTEQAKKQGYAQVLWLDACEHKYIEEVGTSNIFFAIGDELITPPLAGSILGGFTRDSVIRLAESWELKMVQRPITVAEVVEAAENGSLREAFGSGTAAVISPIGELYYQERSYVINEGATGELAQKFYEHLLAIQYGRKEDTFKWLVRVR